MLGLTTRWRPLTPAHLCLVPLWLRGDLPPITLPTPGKPRLRLARHPASPPFSLAAPAQASCFVPCVPLISLCGRCLAWWLAGQAEGLKLDPEGQFGFWKYHLCFRVKTGTLLAIWAVFGGPLPVPSVSLSYPETTRSTGCLSGP